MKVNSWWIVALLLLISAVLATSAIYGNFKSSFTVNNAVNTTPISKPVPEPINQKTAPLPPVKAKVYIPILMYHYIQDYHNPNDPLGVQLSVSPETFDKQMALLSSVGYQTISLQDFADKQYKSKSLIITFDDGYEDQITAALPILEKYHYTATFFIVSGFVGRPGYMTQDEIGQLTFSGMEVGGHTVDHKNLATMIYDKSVLEIARSMVDRNPVFAYPSGQYNLETLDIVSALGVKAAVTTNLGIATENSSLFELPRIRIKEGTDLLKVINQETAVAKRQLPPSQHTSN